MKTAPCPRCQTPVTFEPCEILPRVVPICDGCAKDQDESFARKKREQAWWSHYHRELPTEYQKARRVRVCQDFAEMFAWKAATHPKGIGLIGKSGVGKSSAVAVWLRLARKRFLWWSGTDARDISIKAATEDPRSGAREDWEAGKRVSLLVLDDISQGKMTEAWSSSLFHLLEARTNQGLPTIWTSQIDLPSLRKKIASQNGNDQAQAEAISRRLSQEALLLEA